MTNNKDLIQYFRGANEREAEERIFAEFTRAYEENNRPKGMAMFNHNAMGISALSISAASVPFCAELLKFGEWSEQTETFGYKVCVARIQSSQKTRNRSIGRLALDIRKQRMD